MPRQWCSLEVARLRVTHDASACTLKIKYMTQEKINGFKNLDTYLANLWFNNNEMLYFTARNIIGTMDKANAITEIKELISYEIACKTISDNIDVSKVDWNEIYQDFKRKN